MYSIPDIEGVDANVIEHLRDSLLSCKFMMQKKASTHYAIEVSQAAELYCSIDK